jgi:CHASE2 domain-containing sensor protein
MQLTTAIQLLLKRSEQNARASAIYCYLSAALSAGSAIAAWFWLPSAFLMVFAGGSALVLTAAGFWHGRVARKSVTGQKSLRPLSP